MNTGLHAIPGWMEIPPEHVNSRVEVPEDGSLTLDVYFQALEEQEVFITWDLRATDNRDVYQDDTSGETVLVLKTSDNGMRVYRIRTLEGLVREGHSYLHVFKNGKKLTVFHVYRNTI